MPKFALGLRSQVLLGAFFLVVPLGLALSSVYQFGSAGIQIAAREKLGVTASNPLWETIFAWQEQADAGTAAASLATFGAYVAGDGRELVPETDGTTGASWVAPADLTAALNAAGTDQASFSDLHRKLMANVLILADRSGLVLDPDLDSYYLMLALYQTIPNLLATLTDLRPLTLSTATKLSDSDRLLLASRTRELWTQAQYLEDQFSRSRRGGSLAFRMEDRQSLQMQVGSLVEAAKAVTAAAEAPSLGGPFDAGVFRSHRVIILDSMKGFREQGGRVLTGLLDARMARLQADLTSAFTMAVLGVLLGGAVILFVVASIRSRAYGLVGALGALASGDLTRPVPAKLTRGGDELAKLAASVVKLQTDLRAQVKGIEAVLVDLSQIGANLSSTVEESSASTEEMSAITSTVARSAQSQSEQTDQAQTAVAAMVDRILHSNDLTQGMATQFFLFSQSMEANRIRIRETAAEAKATGDRAEGLEHTGQQGQQSLEILKRSVGGVVEKTHEIEEIVRFILDIADRTNLLSMNAAIEAARAGSSGKGFSVVADEIRKLAVSSSQQAQTIRNLLDGITATVGKTLVDSETTAQAFQTLKQDIAEVRQASHQIAAKMAAQEAEDEQLSAGLNQFAQFYAQLSEVLDAQADGSQRVIKVLESLSGSGREISNSMSEQKIGMEQSTEAAILVRDTTMNLSQVIQVLEVQVGRFKT